MLMLLSLTLISAANAQSSINLDTGLSYINQQNLQSNQAGNRQGTTSRDRSGWRLGGRWAWQQLDAGGGYSATAQASIDQGFAGAGDIRSLALNGAWMRALNANWLTRLNLQLGNYQDDDQPAYNNQSSGADLTLGWFGQQNSGLDINLAWQQEQYDDDPNAAYNGNRRTVGSRYYFTHQRNQPHWSIAAAVSRFDSPAIAGYSYDAMRLSLAYNAWHWKKLAGNILFVWHSNTFDETSTSSASLNNGNAMGGMSSGPGTMPNNTQSRSQQDTYLTTSLSLRYPLNQQWHLVSNVNAGQYRSNLAENRPLLNAYLGLSVKY